MDLGALFYRGPSRLNGEEIIGVVTGLEGGSLNAKTGPMAQVWIVRPDLPPMDAKRQNLDDAICGDCQLRGHNGVDSSCYVTVWLGPDRVYKNFRAGAYLTPTWPELQALLEGRSVRLAAYGDPAAIPFDVWRQLLASVAGWVGYTHQWQRPECDRRLRQVLMASVETTDEQQRAAAAGWRTFRIRTATEPVGAGECICPASDEAGHRVTCTRCQLCRGTDRQARHVAIIVHGKPLSNVATFYRHRGEALPATVPRAIPNAGQWRRPS